MKNFTLRIITFCMFLLMGTHLMAQMPDAITIEPDNATAFDEITLTLDVSLTCPDSALFNADSVMMHSGITIDDAAWSNVVEFNGFGVNGQQPKLILVGPYTSPAISITPATATAWDEITLTLDAKLSCPDSALFNADSVMMHSGVNIDGAAWSNVVEFNGLGANGQQPKLISNGDTTWSITFIPADFYGIEEGAVVTQINCVFNGGDWSLGEGKDFDDEGNCTDFAIPLGALDLYKWAITFTPADFYGVEEGSVVTAINCVFNGGDWSAGEGKDFDEEGNCIDFLIPLSGVGIEEGLEINTYNLYPNPVEKELNIENLKDVNKIEIFTVTGEKVIMLENISSAKVTINTADLQCGLYFVTIHSNNNVQTTKFIKN